MFKKLIVAIISLNICFSGLAYAQHHPQEDLTVEEVEEYINSAENREKALPKEFAIGGTLAVLLALDLSVKKMLANPGLGRVYLELFMNPEERKTGAKMLGDLRKEIMMLLKWTSILKDHYRSKKAIEINNNRVFWEHEIKEMIKKNKDVLALYVYGLPREERKVAYSILAGQPEIFEIIKQQVEAALSEDNIELAKKVYEISEDSEKEEDLLQKKNELIDSLRQSEENFAPAWSFGE